MGGGSGECVGGSIEAISLLHTIYTLKMGKNERAYSMMAKGMYDTIETLVV